MRWAKGCGVAVVAFCGVEAGCVANLSFLVCLSQRGIVGTFTVLQASKSTACAKRKHGRWALVMLASSMRRNSCCSSFQITPKQEQLKTAPHKAAKKRNKGSARKVGALEGGVRCR